MSKTHGRPAKDARLVIGAVLITKAKRKPMPGSQSETRQSNASDANAREVGKRAALLAQARGSAGASVNKIKRKIMAENLFDLVRKTALIIGSSKGIGKAIATELARHGAKMVISCRKLDVYHAIAKTINQEFNDTGGEAIPIAANIGYKD